MMKPTLKRFFSIFATVVAAIYVVGAVASLNFAAAEEGVLKPSEPQEAVAYSYVDGEGVSIAGSDHAGKVVLVHFWAKWCPPCIKELPEMVEMLDSLSDETKANLVVLPISLDRDAETVRAFLASNNLDLPIMRDEGSKAMRALKIRGLPSTLLLDREGREIARRDGVVDWKKPFVRGVIVEAAK